MIRWKEIFFVFVLILGVCNIMFAQTTSTSTQTVMFAVERSISPNLNISSNKNSLSISSENTELQTQLNRQSLKMTVSVAKSDKNFETDNQTEKFSSSSNIMSTSTSHLDLGSLIQTEQSSVVLNSSVILTITE
jgi:hypothetical protein